MPKHRLSPTLLALALGAAFPMQAAVAQTAPAPEARKDVNQLEAVIVTGSRRAENLKEVPLSISAIKSEELDTYNASGQDVRALSGKVPSLNIESDYGRTFPRFYVRGLGNTDFDMNASQPVGLVYDDVVQESIALKGFPVFDMEQVELLRGPQGTLFGRNSPAGVMKFDSAKPGKRLEGYANFSYGRWNAANLEAAINVPLNDDWQMRVAGIAQHQDNRVHNPMPTGTKDLEGYNDKALRLQAAYKNGGFSALFKVQARDYAGTATTFRANIMKRGTNDLVDGYSDGYYPTDGYNSQTLKSSEVSARLRWDFDGMSLYSITAHDQAKFYSRGDVDGGFGSRFGGIPDGPSYPGQPSLIPFDAQTADGIPYLRQTTQEFRLQSNTNAPLQWIGGLYYFNEKLQVDSFNFDTFTPGEPQNGYAVQHQQATSWAAFGNLNYAVTPDFKIRGGLRYTDDKKDFDAQRTSHPFLPAIAPVTAHPKSTNWSWDLGGNYTLDKATSLFARVATGYRAPSIQGRILFFDASAVPAGTSPISIASSEKVLSVEAGFKADLLNNTARITGTVFKYRVKDLQLTAGSGSINQNRLVNAARAEGQGFELDAQAIIARDWRTTLGLSYNDTKIKDPNLYMAPCGNANFQFLQPNTGCNVLNPAGPSGTVSINGNPLPRAPKWVANWTLKYSTEIGNGELTVLTDWAYKDKYNMFPYAAVEYTAKAALEGGLRVGYGWANGKYEVAAFSRNITNHRQIIAAIDFNNLTGIVNEPRTYGAQFKASF
ncbi:TonB-dependent receptor [Pelomonas aquatica]|jgi:iron complex outermembrane receptor protein|uniref:TonB-dependent receptor n=1 Tax=Pelomonas aquatica TaxID=431058 RepID=A0A9X4R3H4_9BURK|nr:TonB-dependent receptor [Pelomonas aquatica]MCY4752969.1 TonB-dependent receptor [Pelomonas aquatica]MDG0862092.1 TonB-dependent receptor [Pelomonas aquatica]